MAVDHGRDASEAMHATPASQVTDVYSAPAAGLRLAGFALAHAAMSVEDGQVLVTLAVISTDGGQGRTIRYPAGSVDESLRRAHPHLARALGPGGRAALAYLDHVRVAKRKPRPALVVEILGHRGIELGRVIQPYRPAGLRIRSLGYLRGFAIRGRPIIDDSTADAIAEATLYDGISEHPEGPRLFRRALASRRRS